VCILAGSRRVAAAAIQVRRRERTAALTGSFGYRVQSGPFVGMQLPTEAAWNRDGDLAPKLLGCYEEELHRPLAELVARKPVRILNIGCAEGYYAVGLARLAPYATVFAYDINEDAQAICRLAAVANGVGSRLIVGGECTPEGLRTQIARDGRTLIVMDCEGAELTLLDPKTVPELATCDILVECHDFLDRAITHTLRERLTLSHVVEDIVEGARDPNKNALVRQWDSLDRWLIVNEGRPEMMNWLLCRARRVEPMP
jgi:SAM-dependent methyltransferase